jgi:hypothetical protein
MPSELERYVSDNALQVGAYVVFAYIVRVHAIFKVLWPFG